MLKPFSFSTMFAATRARGGRAILGRRPRIRRGMCASIPFRTAQALETRVLPAAFSGWSDVVQLSQFSAGDTLDVYRSSPTEVTFVLSSETGNVWEGEDLAAIGLSGNGLTTLTLDTTVWSGGSLWVSSNDDVDVRFHGAGDASAFPFAADVRIVGTIEFVGDTSVFAGINTSDFNAFGVGEVGIHVAAPVATLDGHLRMQSGNIGEDSSLVIDAPVTAKTGVTLLSDVITINDVVSTMPGEERTGEIHIRAGSLLELNSMVRTGDVVWDEPGNTLSGSVLISLEAEDGSLVGNASGRIATGNAHHSVSGGATSGSIGIYFTSDGGELRLPATTALATGVAGVAVFNETFSSTQSGDISVDGASGISSDGAAGKLEIQLGATGGPGHLAWLSPQGKFNAGLSLPIRGSIYVTSENTVSVGHLVTEASAANVVEIESRSGDMVIDSLSSTGLAEDSLSFRAARMIHWKLHQSFPFELGDGTLNLTADEIRLLADWVIGDGETEYPQPDSIRGTGRIVLQPNSLSRDIRIGGLEILAATPGALVLSHEDLLAIGSSLDVVIGRPDGTGAIILENNVEFESGVTLYGGSIINGEWKGEDPPEPEDPEEPFPPPLRPTLSSGSATYPVRLVARSGSIGDLLNPIRIDAPLAPVHLEATAGGGAGDIHARLEGARVASFGTDVFLTTGAGRDQVSLDAHGLSWTGDLVTNDDLTLTAREEAIGVANGSKLSAASLNLTAKQGIHTNQTGLIESTVGNLALTSTHAPIGLPDGSNLTPVNVLVAGRLSLATEAMGADGDVSVTSTSALAIDALTSGPTQNNIRIGSTVGNLTFVANASLFSNLTASAAGSVAFTMPGALEVGSLNVTAAGGITGSGRLRTTGAAGMNLSGSGGIGQSGAPLNLELQNGGRLSTASSGQQFLRAWGEVFIQSLNAGSSSIDFVSGVFSLSGNNGIADSSSVLISSGGIFDLDAFDEHVAALTINQGELRASGGQLTTSSGSMTVNGGTFTGIGGSTDVDVSGFALWDEVSPMTGSVNVGVGVVQLGTGLIAPNATVVVTGGGTVTSGSTIPSAQVGQVMVDTGGTATAGNSPGILGANRLQMNPGSRLLIEVFGTAPGTGHDQVFVDQTASIGGASLELEFEDYVPPAGAVVTILRNDSATPVVGEFQGLPDGSLSTVNGRAFRINYAGGDGNDVTLTFLEAPAIAGFVVQNGETQRSYVNRVDVTVSGAVDFESLLAGGRIRLVKRDLSGNNATAAQLGAVALVGNTLQFDWGVQGIGGNRASLNGDGHYTLELDLDGDGIFESQRRFYRLLGDLNGDRQVTQADMLLFQSQLNQPLTSANRSCDFDGNGVIDARDRLVLQRSLNRQLSILLILD